MRVIGTALGVFLLLLIMLGIVPNLLLIPFTILFGWIPAAKRLGGNLPFSAEEVGLFFGAIILLVLGVHWFLQQFKPWRFRWTFAITGGVALILLAIMSVVGVVHQSGWILLSKEPVFSRRGRWLRDQVDLMNTASAIGNMARSNGVDRSQLMLCDPAVPDTYDGKRPWEKCNVLFVQPTNGCFAVVWLRDERLHQRIGSACVYSDGRVLLDKRNAILENAQPHASHSY